MTVEGRTEPSDAATANGRLLALSRPRATVEAIRNGAAAAYTLAERDEQPSPLRDIGPGAAAFPDVLARFLVAVPVYTIEALVGCGFLRSADQDELAAIMTALRRLGREPDILRVT